MARDKRLHRAVARRRYRERLRAEAEQAAGDTESSASGATAGGDSEASTAGEQPRRSFLGALADFKLPDVRADVLALPSIARRSWAFPVAALAVAAGFLVGLDPNVFMLREQPGEPMTAGIARLVYQFTLLPPPVTVVFLGAVLAPRANWLVGAIAGLASTVAFLALLSQHGPPDYFPYALDGNVALQALGLYLPIYLLLGGFAGWYRRWIISRQAHNRQAAEQRRRSKAREQRRAARR